MTTCGIYGFEFTGPFEAAGLEFAPLYTHHAEAKRLARDERAHHLTGTVSGASLLDGQIPYRLGYVLSFMERLDVRLSAPSEDSVAVTDPRSYFGAELSMGKRPAGGGELINPDSFRPHRDARRDFIEMAMGRLADDAFCQRTKFRLLLIKAAETCRQRSAFLEVSYFLLMSGLEAFCRAVQGDEDSSAAVPMVRTLMGYGFDVCADNLKDLPRAISTYTHIRNAIFHNGELTRTVPLGNGSSYSVDGVTYLLHLQMLVNLTVMKAIGFEDFKRNWDGWYDYEHPHGGLGQFPTEFLAPLQSGEADGSTSGVRYRP